MTNLKTTFLVEAPISPTIGELGWKRHIQKRHQINKNGKVSARAPIETRKEIITHPDGHYRAYGITSTGATTLLRERVSPEMERAICENERACGY